MRYKLALPNVSALDELGVPQETLKNVLPGDITLRKI